MIRFIARSQNEFCVKTMELVPGTSPVVDL